eukprot:scaffold1916_cov294-Prasinococcus_capsulatus_cf.AAC.3
MRGGERGEVHQMVSLRPRGVVEMPREPKRDCGCYFFSELPAMGHSLVAVGSDIYSISSSPRCWVQRARPSCLPANDMTVLKYCKATVVRVRDLPGSVAKSASTYLCHYRSVKPDAS